MQKRLTINVHQTNILQNRIESYHQLRAAIAQVGGKKALTGQTDIDIEISNQCGRLVANAIIYYNATILSRLLERCPGQAQGAGAHHVNLTGGLAAPAAGRALHLRGWRQSD
jgi:hypothetical protein